MTCFAYEFLGCLAAMVARGLRVNNQALNSDLAVIRLSVTFNSSDEVPSPRRTIPCMPARLHEDFRSKGKSGMLSVLVASVVTVSWIPQNDRSRFSAPGT